MGYGDFWAHMLVAEGAVDGAVDAVGVKVWDIAAVQPIVEEAGGRFTDAEGVSRVDGGTAISSNGYLHATLLDGVRPRLASAPSENVRLQPGARACLVQPDGPRLGT